MTTSSSKGSFAEVIKNPMLAEAWELALELCAQDGMATPGLLLWRDADEEIQFTRVMGEVDNDELGAAMELQTQGFAYDHAALLSRSEVLLKGPGEIEEAAGDRTGVRSGIGVFYLCRDGTRLTYFAEVTGADAQLSVGRPIEIRNVLSPLDALRFGVPRMSN